MPEHNSDPGATTWTVTTLVNSSDGSCAATCSLRDAVAAANNDSGDTIVFQAGLTGTITLSNATGYGYILIKSSMTIQGPGANLLTVSGNNAVTVFSVFIGGDKSPFSASIAGLTFADASPDAIVWWGNGNGAMASQTVSISECVISTNSIGIDNNGVMTVNNCTFSGNSGSGISNEGELTVTNSNFSGNGAGITTSRGTVAVSNSTFSSNTNTGAVCGGCPVGGYQDPGGAAIAGVGGVTVTNCIFTGNSAPYGSGGAINIYGSGTVTVTGSTFSNNTAGTGLSGPQSGEGNGGAVAIFEGTLALIDSTFVGNAAPNGLGGAIQAPVPSCTSQARQWR